MNKIIATINPGWALYMGCEGVNGVVVPAAMFVDSADPNVESAEFQGQFIPNFSTLCRWGIEDDLRIQRFFEEHDLRTFSTQEAISSMEILAKFSGRLMTGFSLHATRLAKSDVGEVREVVGAKLKGMAALDAELDRVFKKQMKKWEVIDPERLGYLTLFESVLVESPAETFHGYVALLMFLFLLDDTMVDIENPDKAKLVELKKANAVHLKTIGEKLSLSQEDRQELLSGYEVFSSYSAINFFNGELTRLLEMICEQISALIPNPRNRVSFAMSLKTYMQKSEEELLEYCVGNPKGWGTEYYERLREGVAGVWPCFEYIFGLHQTVIPKALRDDKEWQKLMSLAVMHISLVNDLSSWPKEKKYGLFTNLVILKADGNVQLRDEGESVVYKQKYESRKNVLNDIYHYNEAVKRVYEYSNLIMRHYLAHEQKLVRQKIQNMMCSLSEISEYSEIQDRLRDLDVCMRRDIPSSSDPKSWLSQYRSIIGSLSKESQLSVAQDPVLRALEISMRVCRDWMIGHITWEQETVDGRHPSKIQDAECSGGTSQLKIVAHDLKSDLSRFTAYLPGGISGGLSNVFVDVSKKGQGVFKPISVLELLQDLNS